MKTIGIAGDRHEDWGLDYVEGEALADFFIIVNFN